MTRAQVYARVKFALSKGILVRPEQCQRCGETPKPTRDGRAAIQAHHHDYDKPLDVEWICARCHRVETPLPEKMGAKAAGEVNGQAKLTEEIVQMILTTKESGASIARRIGVDKSTVNRVRRGETWAAAAPAAPTAKEGEQAGADWISNVVRDVSELPDRTSPEGQPDMMLVTVNELHDIIALHAPTTTAAPAQAAGEEVRDAALEEAASICDDRHYNWRFGDGEDSVSGPKECAGLIRALKRPAGDSKGEQA